MVRVVATDYLSPLCGPAEVDRRVAACKAKLGAADPDDITVHVWIDSDGGQHITAELD